MSLRQIVDVVPADQVGAVHFMAIGGAGMSGIATLFQGLGTQVSGCDRADSPTMQQLAADGIRTFCGHDTAHLTGVDTVIVSTAIREDNAELLAAQRLGLRVWHRSAGLASLMLGKRGVSVAGTHGKTTTSALCAVMLTQAGADPSYVIGAPLATTGTSAHQGGGEIFVVEADESDGSFLQYPTEVAIITNIEPDHLDNWGTAADYAAGFYDFASAKQVQAVIINIDDPGARSLARHLADTPVRLFTYGEAAEAELRITEVEFSGVQASAVLRHGQESWRLALQIPGRHNLANAAAAFALGRYLGYDPQSLIAGAEAFTSTLRRFQFIAEIPGATGQPIRIFDDYAHHPTELRATLTAAHRAKGQGRLVACFQPHLYSRTRDFATEFGAALAIADEVVLTDIYPAREEPIPGVTGQLLVDSTAGKLAAKRVHYCPDKTELPSYLAGMVQDGDLVLTLGAGDITLVGPLLADILRGADER